MTTETAAKLAHDNPFLGSHRGKFLLSAWATVIMVPVAGGFLFQSVFALGVVGFAPVVLVGVLLSVALFLAASWFGHRAEILYRQARLEADLAGDA